MPSLEIINPWVPKSSIISVNGFYTKIGIYILRGTGSLWVKKAYYWFFDYFEKITKTAETDVIMSSMLWSKSIFN